MRRPTVVEWVLVAAVAFCALHGTRDEPAHPPQVRCAILLHGLGPRASKASCTSSAYRAQKYALPLLDGAVVRANPAVAFDVVGHSWSAATWADFDGCERDDAGEPALDLQRVLLGFKFGPNVGTVRFSAVPAAPRRASTASFESLAAAIRLALSFPGTYDWFLALRFDVVFFSDFDLSRLNPKLLYFANMCVPQKTTDLGRGGLSRFERFWAWDQCAPDFYYAASPTNLALAFGDFAADAAARVFNATSCKGGHGLVAGRLTYLRHELHVPIGRYKYHLQDVHYVRDHYVANFTGSFAARLACVRDGRTRWGTTAKGAADAYDVDAAAWNDAAAPHPFSRCPPRNVYRDACRV